MALDLTSIGKKIEPMTKSYTWKDVILYALGVGAGFDELEYCYESKLKVIPSFAVGPVMDFLFKAGSLANVNPAGILHGEHELIIHNAIPPEGGTLTTEGKITHIYDKGPGKGAVVRMEADTYHSDGQKLYTNIPTVFSRLDGGFGGENAPAETLEFPDRAPDFEEPAAPSADQPLVYRLSGDFFALHVDPDFAKMAGFEKPIMHGLCTFGFACRALIRHLFPGEPERLKRMKVRFSRPLYPGDPIKTQIWKLEEGKAYFRTLNAKTGDVVIDRGVVEWLSAEEAQRRAKGERIRFDNRVAVVTGAGHGLGRLYALELAKRGAKVVVNDLGGARDGTGESRSAADAVVEEIKALGGEAVANYDSVTTVQGGENIVNTALKAFGRIDILINNAGILRDRSFMKMVPEDWDAVLAVHLQGAYNVTRPAFMAMRQQGYGRIVMTTSAAGLFGNFGQTNYSAAKMGLVGLMNTLKLEGEKYNIKVNTIAPTATTRLSEDVLPPDFIDKLKPEFVAPLVLFLCSEECPVTGGIYNAGMGYYGRAAIMSGPGAWVGEEGEVPTPEAVVARWKEITSLEGAKPYQNANMAMMDMLSSPRVREVAKEEKKESAGAGGSSAQAVFDKLPSLFQADKAGGVDVVFQFKLSGAGGGDWYVQVKDGACAVKSGAHEKPTTTLKMSDEDFVSLMSGKLPAMQAYTSGKLKIEGDLMKSQLIQKLFKF